MCLKIFAIRLQSGKLNLKWRNEQIARLLLCTEDFYTELLAAGFSSLEVLYKGPEQWSLQTLPSAHISSQKVVHRWFLGTRISFSSPVSKSQSLLLWFKALLITHQGSYYSRSTCFTPAALLCIYWHGLRADLHPAMKHYYPDGSYLSSCHVTALHHQQNITWGKKTWRISTKAH